MKTAARAAADPRRSLSYCAYAHVQRLGRNRRRRAAADQVRLNGWRVGALGPADIIGMRSVSGFVSRRL